MQIQANKYLLQTLLVIVIEESNDREAITRGMLLSFSFEPDLCHTAANNIDDIFVLMMFFFFIKLPFVLIGLGIYILTDSFL
jgi:hypothetical protein